MTAHSFTSIYGDHQDIKRAIHLAKQFSKNKQPVLITGETGTGKTLFAQEMANASVPHAALTHMYSPILNEETLQKAFTEKNNQILYLDEVGALSIPMQHKVIHFLETSPATKVIASSSLSIEALRVSSTFYPSCFIV